VTRQAPLAAFSQAVLPSGLVPQDVQLRAALVRLACSAEIYGPDGLGIDMATPDGRAGWADVERAIRWIYDYAIDPLVDERGTDDAAAADR
jgi:hypothetical protein